MLEVQEDYQIKRLKEIILSWSNDSDSKKKIDPTKIENIELKSWMITYTYEWVLCACENQMYIDTLGMVTLAKIAETKLAIEERIWALR